MAGEPMPRYSYPHTIDNGAGERITYLRRVPLAVGERLEGENVTQPGAGPPMHVHYLQDEVFTVEVGRLGYRRAGERDRFAGPGETVAFRAGEPHCFWNAGTGELLSTAYVEPADNAEYLLTQLFESMRRRGGTRPDPFDAAFLLTRHRNEFAITEIPPPVQRALFPLVVAIGSLLGKYGRFADAPEPVRR